MVVTTIPKVDVITMADMMEKAIAFCAQRIRTQTMEETMDTIRKGDCQACQHVKYYLAKQIGEILGSVDENVKAIYIYEPDYAAGIYDATGEEPNLASGINMIAWVGRKTAALSSVVASLDEALMAARAPLLCPKASRICYSLDAVIVDDEEVSNRMGYGALIGSLHVHPTMVWSKDGHLPE